MVVVEAAGGGRGGVNSRYAFVARDFDRVQIHPGCEAEAILTGTMLM